MNIVSVIDEERWSQFVSDHPKGTIFHTPQMASVFAATRRHTPLVLASVNQHEEIVALLTSVRVQSLPDPLGSVASRSLIYAEPICRETAEGTRALAALIAEHDRRVRSRVLFTEVRACGPQGAERVGFSNSGYEYEGYLNYLIDLRVTEEHLWHNLTNTCRANVRRSERHGVVVREIEKVNEVADAYFLLHRTYQNARVPLAHPSLFLNAFNILYPLSMCKIFMAYHKGQPVGASVLLLYKKVVYEWYWGVERLRSIYPAECITWHRILWGKQNGFDTYDFGGAGWPDKPYGVRDFKAKFGGTLVNYGRYRRVYSRWKFALAERTYEAARRTLYSRIWKPA